MMMYEDRVQSMAPHRRASELADMCPWPPQRSSLMRRPRPDKLHNGIVAERVAEVEASAWLQQARLQVLLRCDRPCLLGLQTVEYKLCLAVSADDDTILLRQ